MACRHGLEFPFRSQLQVRSYLSQWTKAPWYSFLGGVFAAVFVTINIFIIPRVGVAAALSAVLVGQLGMSLVLDALGLLALERVPISLPRILGLSLLLIGMRLMFVKAT